MLFALLVLLHGSTSIIIDEGRIVSIGALTPPPGATVFDASGMTILPGFHDSHLHPMTGAMRLLRCHVATPADLAKCQSQGEWLIGITQVPLTLQQLDAIEKPALFTSEDGYTAWANSRALKAARQPATSSKLIGEPLEIVRGVIPKPSQLEYREALRRATHLANSFGITSVVDAAATPPALEAYAAAEKAGELTVRVQAAQVVDPHRGVEQIAAMLQWRDRLHSKMLRADAAKFFLDGEIGLKTAALLGSAENRNTLFRPEQLNELVQRLDAEDFCIHMHAMGDGAVRIGLDAYENAIRLNGPRDRRHQIAHLGVVDPRDIPRFAQLGVAANFQPLWLAPSDPDFAPQQRILGSERAYWMMPLRQLSLAHGRILAGSDWPQPSMNPLDAIDFGSNYVDRGSLLSSYTRDAAWAAREDGFDGSIEIGKEADLVVLDGRKVVLTLLHGEPVYRAE